MNAGGLATVAVVLTVAGVAGASLVDAGRGGGGGSGAGKTATATVETTPDLPAAIGTLGDRLLGLPLVAPGTFVGRLVRRQPACRWLMTDLATGEETDVTPPGRCPLWRPGWRYSFEFAVEQSANAPIVRGVEVREGTRSVGRIDLPHEPTGGAAGTPGGAFALCLRGEHNETRIYFAARLVRRVAACGPVAFGGEFLFRDAGRFRDARGRTVLDFGEPAPFVQPTGNGLVVAVAIAAGRVDVYRGRRRIKSFPLPAGVTTASVLDTDASATGQVVLIRVLTNGAADLLVLRGRTVERTRVGSVLNARLSPDGRAVAAVVAGVAVLLDAVTLAPVAQLGIGAEADLAAWTP
jgi:hypothetical protein